MDNVNIYEDLHNTDLGEKIVKLQEDNGTLIRQIQILEHNINKLCRELTQLKDVERNLTRNISELYKTAKVEIDRKDRMIAELRSQLDEVLRNRGKRRLPFHNDKIHHANKMPRHEVLAETRSNIIHNGSREHEREQSLRDHMSHNRTSHQSKRSRSRERARDAYKSRECSRYKRNNRHDHPAYLTNNRHNLPNNKSRSKSRDDKWDCRKSKREEESQKIDQNETVGFKIKQDRQTINRKRTVDDLSEGEILDDESLNKSYTSNADSENVSVKLDPKSVMLENNHVESKASKLENYRVELNNEPLKLGSDAKSEDCPVKLQKTDLDVSNNVTSNSFRRRRCVMKIIG